VESKMEKRVHSTEWYETSNMHRSVMGVAQHDQT
jgi:hypothetical protein